MARARYGPSCSLAVAAVDCQHMIETVRGAGYRLARLQTVGA